MITNRCLVLRFFFLSFLSFIVWTSLVDFLARNFLAKMGVVLLVFSISSTHPSRDVVFSSQILAIKRLKIISVHDVWEPLKQALLASRDMISFSQICVSKLQRFFAH